MSRIGRTPIKVPAGVQVSVGEGEVNVTGPKGQLTQRVPAQMDVTIEDGQIVVARPGDDKTNRSLHGLTRTLIANMVEGVTNGYRKTLEISGVGYRAGRAGTRLTLQVGFSHPVEIVPPQGVTFEVETPTRFHIVGIDKQLVGETAARVRKIRPPEPYLGKGIRYAGERIRRKAGKAGKVGAKK
ncbi:MAG TPA: 50S ribosomal protein L6 [Chloroflexota bacterium]|nr:50S ribosomal protein L6 [Chloroflexota bacterium]